MFSGFSNTIIYTLKLFAPVTFYSNTHSSLSRTVNNFAMYTTHPYLNTCVFFVHPLLLYVPQFVCHNGPVTSLIFFFFIFSFRNFMCVYFCYFDILLVPIFCSLNNLLNDRIDIYIGKRHGIIIIAKIIINVSD